VFGFELLMAPYAVAHLKSGLLLQELGYEFDSDERLGIYLTNTLEEAIKRSEAMFSQWIADEANAAADIKRYKQTLDVSVGNPTEYPVIPLSLARFDVALALLAELAKKTKRSLPIPNIMPGEVTARVNMPPKCPLIIKIMAYCFGSGCQDGNPGRNLALRSKRDFRC
jgi:hypothetical protein